ncbi:dentin sialophosphoprotein-like [Patiria miniata]|uniref:Uncharacterized protein n=1 Tax=Patiria miniata TaxID=46514 RepID=A0A914AT07_PATMI|nr:dentin sialophosphoprotein-like [Patiria miniata]
MATERRQRSSDTREATASGDENTSLLATAVVHAGTGNVKPTAPPEEGTGLDSSTVTNQPTSRASLAIDRSHGRQSTHITASLAARGEQTSAGQDSTDAAESQQMADQPAVSTTATRERQTSAGQDSTDAAESQHITAQPAISTTATSERQSTAGQDSTDAAESQQMANQPAISTTATSERQSSAGQDSTDASDESQQTDQPAVGTTATSERQSSAGQDSTDASDESQQTDQPAVSTTVTSEGQSSASQDSVHAAESQQMAAQPAISAATREVQSSASHDSANAAEFQHGADQPAISTAATRVGPTYVSQDSVHAAESVQMQAQPAVISRTSTTEGQSSAGLDSVDTAESQQTADQPAISTATREGQSSASHDSVDAAESQQMAAQPAISTTATRVGPTYVSQDSVHAAESVQMQAQPAVISRTSTTEGQSSAGLDSVDATVADGNQLASIGHYNVPTSRGIPASSVPSASNEWQPTVSHLPDTSVVAQPSARNQPFNWTSGTTGASSTVSPSVPVPRSPNKRVTKKDMQKLAGNLGDWDRLAVALDMSEADIHGFKEENKCGTSVSAVEDPRFSKGLTGDSTLPDYIHASQPAYTRPSILGSVAWSIRHSTCVSMFNPDTADEARMLCCPSPRGWLSRGLYAP